ncbi:hypothetical protein DLAC_07658 [Tieghemostelium lacteum]|uniref:Uncharacterized protein n=1 Tax=Tieghemostelium lacteum TaxID=361077 RepID=A0A151ZD26_TIELA|nr:hypothetical protein DLAC_07658 [Tieghemostelium lacteum]|eukprot:KYQ91853.1 hypothetical protein DLAC_07658 [Tieghemostelium lacteum]
MYHFIKWLENPIKQPISELIDACVGQIDQFKTKYNLDRTSRNELILISAQRNVKDLMDISKLRDQVKSSKLDSKKHYKFYKVKTCSITDPFTMISIWEKSIFLVSTFKQPSRVPIPSIINEKEWGVINIESWKNDNNGKEKKDKHEKLMISTDTDKGRICIGDANRNFVHTLYAGVYMNKKKNNPPQKRNRIDNSENDEDEEKRLKKKNTSQNGNNFTSQKIDNVIDDDFEIDIEVISDDDYEIENETISENENEIEDDFEFENETISESEYENEIPQNYSKDQYPDINEEDDIEICK